MYKRKKYHVSITKIVFHLGLPSSYAMMNNKDIQGSIMLALEFKE
jgi:hypothetical protein